MLGTPPKNQNECLRDRNPQLLQKWEEKKLVLKKQGPDTPSSPELCGTFGVLQEGLLVSLRGGLLADPPERVQMSETGRIQFRGSTVSNTELSEFLGPHQVLGGESSVSSSQLIISVQKRTHRVWLQNSPSLFWRRTQ